MTDLFARIVVERINRTHDTILKVCDPLSEEDIRRRPSAAAPPIGWHLWHITRWTDHFQASFPGQVQIWESDHYAAQWMADTTLLGPMQAGMGMPILVATEFVEKVGKVRLLDYARLSFNACREVVRGLDMTQLQSPRQSFAAYVVREGNIIEAPGADTTLLGDCDAHIAHANRHLGMIEALIGAVLERKGSATI